MWTEYLTNKDHKYRNTNIVVLRKGTKNSKNMEKSLEYFFEFQLIRFIKF